MSERQMSKERQAAQAWDRLLAEMWNTTGEHVDYVRRYLTGQSTPRYGNKTCERDCRCPLAALKRGSLYERPGV